MIQPALAKPARLASGLLLLASLTPISAQAADLDWSGTSSTIWDTAALNWQTGSVAWSQTSATVPLNRAFFNSAAGTVTIGENLSAQTIDFTGNGTTFSAASAQTITLVSSGVGLNNQINLASSAAATIGDNITIVLSTPASARTVSVGANATLTVAGTGARISALNASFISGAGSVVIGTGGQYVQTVGALVVGNGNAGGTLRVEGGSVSVATNLVLNNAGSGTSTITLSSGTISTPTAAASGGVRFGGAAGSGVFNLDGGTLTTSKIYENNAGITSTFNFNGGTLTVGQTNDTDFMTGLNTATVKAGGALINTQANNATIAQALTTDAALGGAPDGGLTKSGSGRLSLTGTNTYTGTTTVSAGTLAIGSGGSLASGNALTLDVSGLADFANAGQTLGAVSNANTTTNALNFSASTGTITLASLSGAGNTTFASNATLTSAISAGTVNVAGLLTANISGGTVGAGSLSATTVSGGTNTITGAAGITTLSSGTTTVGGVATIGTLSGGTANLNGATSAVTTLNGGTVNLGSSTALTVSDGTTSGAITGTGGSLTKSGSGTLTLNGTTTFTGATTLSGGTLAFNAAAALGTTSGVNLADTTTLTYTGAASTTFDRDISVTSGTGFLRNTGAGTLTLSGALSKNGTVLTFAQGLFDVTGAISGASANSDLVVDAATVTLSSANTYNGPTFLRNGATLNANIAGALPTATRSALVMDDSGTGSSTLTLGADQVVASLAGAATSTVALGVRTLTVGTSGGSTTFSGTLTGSGGSFVKDGTSTLILVGTSTYTGTTTVSAGTLMLNKSGGSALASTTSVVVASGATVALGAASQINSAATLTLNGGTLALNGFSQTLGTLSLTANSTLDLGTTAALAFADSHSLNWGTSTLSVSNFTSGTTQLSFGSNATGLTAGQLGLFRFVEFGNSAARIDDDGFIAPVSVNYLNTGSTDIVIATPITGTTTVTQTGTGSTSLTAPIGTPNTSTGLASVTQGTLVIGTAAGGNWAGNVTVSGTGTLKGRGDIGGAVIVDSDGTYSPGNSPAIQNVGSLTVNTGGLVEIELDGATAGNGAFFHDKIVSAGAVTLNTGSTLIGQTIFTGSSVPAYLPTLGVVHTVITGSTVTGKFEDYTFAPDDNAAGITWLPEYTATAVNLYAVPRNYATAVAGLNANQTQVGTALQSLRNSGLPFELDQRTTLDARSALFNGLKTQNAAGLRTAYDQLTPEKLTALAATTFQSASILNSSLQQRSAELRRFGPASVSLNGVATPAATQDYSVETVIEDGLQYPIAKAKPKKRFGYFASATGAFAAVDGSSDRLGSFSQTGAATAGVDYALNHNQSVGLVVNQALADTDFSSNSGTARTTTSRVGVFHDYHNAGFFVNTSVSAGFSNYDSKRKIAFLNQTANGETQGLSYGGQLATGYDFKVGGFILGPTASVAYDHAHINGFEETGSAADLRVGRQNADSLITKFGVHISRPFVAKKIGWIPDVSLSASRQSFNPNSITARLAAGGDAFKVKPQSGGSEYINPGASLSALLPNGWTVRLSYDAILNPQSAEHRVNLSVGAGF